MARKQLALTAHDPELARLVRNLTEELARSLRAPIIVFGAWGDSLPDRLKEEIPLQRLLRIMQANKQRDTGLLDLATDAEACAYLYTACMEHPPDHDWAQIYLYLATKFMENKVQGGVPTDVRVTELTRNQQDDLDRLKRWIVAQQRKHMKEVRAENETRVQTGHHVEHVLASGPPPARNRQFDFGLKGD